MTAAPAARFIATRQNGRPVVLDQTTGKATQTRTRTAAEEKAAKLNRQHEAETRTATADDAVANFYAQFQANRQDAEAQDAANAAAITEALDAAELTEAARIDAAREVLATPPAPAEEAAKPRKARTPKVALPGESPRVYRLIPGQQVVLRGIGTVTITEFAAVETDPKLRRIGYVAEDGAAATVDLSKDAKVLVAG